MSATRRDDAVKLSTRVVNDCAAANDRKFSAVSAWTDGDAAMSAAVERQA